ncbi:MAG: hypothetical protein JSS82_02965 [Bacteroidetes bacterium]|nr:hypothetical protein [Bacteroidota bacterium]
MRIATIILFMLSSLQVAAQFPKYYVYVIKGKGYCNVLREGSNRWERLISHNFLFEKDSLYVGKGCELLLVSADQKRLNYEQVGTISVSQIGIKVDSYPVSITRKYFQTLFKNVFNPIGASENIERHVISSSWGGASRSMADCLNLISPSDDEIFGADSVCFQWKAVSALTFDLTVYDDSDNIVLRQYVNGNSIHIAVAQIVKKHGDRDFHWTVKPNNEVCNALPKGTFIVLDSAVYKTNTLSIIAGVPKNSDSFIYFLQLSDAFGKKGYINEAIHYLQLALANNQ